MNKSHAAWIASVLIVVCGCARAHFDNPFKLRDASASIPEQPGRDAMASAGSGAVDVGSKLVDAGVDQPATKPGSTAAQIATSTNADAATAASTEVWVGELWSVAPALCDPNAAWSTTPLVVQATGYTERVVLMLEQSANGKLAGRIQLGQGMLPTSPGDAPYAMGDSGSYWSCSIQNPTKGVDYTLLGAVRTPDRLSFELDASQVWDTWCAGQSSPCPGGGCNLDGPICACTAGKCKAASHSRLAFDLAVTKDTIEGEGPLGGGFGTPAQLRLRRIQ